MHVVVSSGVDVWMGSSSQPQNRPGVKQVVLDVVLVGVAGFVVVMVDVVVVLSLQPNQPLCLLEYCQRVSHRSTYGVRHVVVVVVVVSVVVAVPVVVSSRHPHQPLFLLAMKFDASGQTLTVSCRSRSGCASWKSTSTRS
jgi:hypothetical protein